ncbi:MAG TPA: hypothetical protein VFS04_11535 [Alphaproteobacteria bacterium]|nr:hypothetical protein [Alphaproteobacteria bacterium]
MDLSYNACRLRAALLEQLSPDDDSGYIDALIAVADPIFAQLPETTSMAKLATLYCAVAAHFWTDDDAPDAPFDVLRARGIAPALPYLVFWPVAAPREDKRKAH